MKLVSSKDAEKTYLAYPAKNNELPKWANPEKTKPKKIRIDGEFYEVWANPEKSNYIYFQHGDKVYAIHAKEKSVFDMLDETSLKIFVKPVKEKPAKKEKAPKAEKAKAATAKKTAAKSTSKSSSAKTPKVNRAAAGAESVPPPTGETQMVVGEDTTPEGDTGGA